MDKLSITDVRRGSVVRYKRRLYFVHDLYKPCKLIYAHAVDFIPYKSKRGNKAIVVYQRFKFDKAELVIL